MRTRFDFIIYNFRNLWIDLYSLYGISDYAFQHGGVFSYLTPMLNPSDWAIAAFAVVAGLVMLRA